MSLVEERTDAEVLYKQLIIMKRFIIELHKEGFIVLTQEIVVVFQHLLVQLIH